MQPDNQQQIYQAQQAQMPVSAGMPPTQQPIELEVLRATQNNQQAAKAANHQTKRNYAKLVALLRDARKYDLS